MEYDTFYSEFDSVSKVNEMSVLLANVPVDKGKEDVLIRMTNSMDAMSALNYLKDGLDRTFRFIKNGNGDSIFQVADCRQNIKEEFPIEFASAWDVNAIDG